ncbi:YceD family protein [Thermomonospora catenispora]|uniref:YceD family protein n=1 Tax=Thermomonospora catenispora TaxID=2493090 RepID=UPI001122FFF7|nr:DUF177 domain-containing protein [Thermomonospora catenispora]TNY36090.1 DUF177 domain-containing protein [Thermomonospora catenispora]
MSHGSRKALIRIDANAPLVLDTRALDRRPGSMQELTCTVPAPADLGVEMVGVPEGADVELDLRLESVLEGILVTGTARMPLTGECARCLDPLEEDFEADFQELFVYPDTRSGGEAEEDEHRIEGDAIDLEPVLRDTVVLALPLSPLCRDDCPGLCPDCGARLADVEPGHRHDTVDPRWAALRDLTDLREEKQEG